jgi:hypothetical protein
MRLPSAKSLRLYAVLSVVPAALLAAWALLAGQGQHVLAHGPLLAKHQGTACASCHFPAPGSTRQQIQAELRYLPGLRATPVDFGYQPVQSAQCLTCHERANDRHPIYRFREPRFRDAAQIVEATSCMGCHSEHGTVKISSGTTFCAACHQDLKLKADPIDVPHITLIKQENWGSCMTCHDFHGNHRYDVPNRMADALPLGSLRSYVSGGADPYGGFKQVRGQMP